MFAVLMAQYIAAILGMCGGAVMVLMDNPPLPAAFGLIIAAASAIVFAISTVGLLLQEWRDQDRN